MPNCRTCQSDKPQSEFYAGFSKCKECHKAAVKANYEAKLLIPEWREKELNRQREKSRRHRDEGRKPDSEAIAKAKRKWEALNKHKKSATVKVNNAIRCGKMLRKPCEKCGEQKAEAHHDDYSKPLVVRWLCDKHHKEHHVEMRRLERFTRDAMAQALAFPAVNDHEQQPERSATDA